MFSSFSYITNPFRPTGPFLAPQINYFVKCLIDFLLSKCCFTFLYVEQDVNFAWQSCSSLKKITIKKKNVKKSEKIIVLQSGWNGLMYLKIIL